ncbi:unnamed protein product [Caenorhabditis brenneri]
MSADLQDEDDPPEVKYIDSLEYENFSNNPSDYSQIKFRWLSSFEEEEQKWFRILNEFVTTLAGKNGYCFRIIEKYARALNFQGSEVVQTRGGLRNISNASPRAIKDNTNFPLLLKDLSVITKNVNLAYYMTTALHKIGQSATSTDTTEKLLIHERVANLYLFQLRYASGLQNILANHRLLRHFRYGIKKGTDHLTDYIRSLFLVRDMFVQAPEASSLALQLIIEDWNCSLQDEKIVQISHGNTLQMRSIHVKGDAYYFLNETLNCALASNYVTAQVEMEDFDSIISSNSTNARGKQKFQFWRMMSKFDRNRRTANPQGFVVTAQRWEEECRFESTGSVFLEGACKIRKLCGQTDELVKTITETVTLHPSLGPRMLHVAERCDIGYESDALIHLACDMDTSNDNRVALHPSESLWLDYVDQLIDTVGRFGSVRKTLEKSLKVMFEFLDFDSNRFNERAWVLFGKVLELSDPSFVYPEWRSRVSWWPKYQRSKARDGRKMNKSVQTLRNDVLKELEEIVI